MCKSRRYWSMENGNTCHKGFSISEGFKEGLDMV